MRRLSVYLLLLVGVVFITPVLFDQLCMFVFLGKLPFLNVNLSATSMIVFWLALVPVCRILRAAIPVSFDDIKELIQYISQKRLDNSVLYQDHLSIWRMKPRKQKRASQTPLWALKNSLRP